MKNHNDKIKRDFQLLMQPYNGASITYLDNASTTQKPTMVIDAINDFYTKSNANVGRGVYHLAEEATQKYESARAHIAQFIGSQAHEIIFTMNATHGINAVAHMMRPLLRSGDEIIVSELEHHANLLPWQYLAKELHLILKFIPVRPDGTLDQKIAASLFSKKTKLLALTHCSNALGTHVDVAYFAQLAKQVGALTLVDACQSVPHGGVDVRKLGADFLVFSGHKMLGPTGIGVLYINERLHESLDPFSRGGGIVYEADWFDASWVKSPQKFEAGTPPIAQAIGLSAAIGYLEKNAPVSWLREHEAGLCRRLMEGLSGVKGISLLGPQQQLAKEGHMVSFVVHRMHAHDVAAFLDQSGICVRAGHFCAQPLAKELGYHAAVRASFYLYNTLDDVDKLVAALLKIANK